MQTLTKLKQARRRERLELLAIAYLSGATTIILLLELFK